MGGDYLDYLERLAFAPLPPAEAQDVTESIHGVTRGHPHAAASQHRGFDQAIKSVCSSVHRAVSALIANLGFQ